MKPKSLKKFSQNFKNQLKFLKRLRAPIFLKKECKRAQYFLVSASAGFWARSSKA
jgi:hypothetical protein